MLSGHWRCLLCGTEGWGGALGYRRHYYYSLSHKEPTNASTSTDT